MTAPASEEKSVQEPPAPFETWLDYAVACLYVAEPARAELTALRAALAERTRERDEARADIEARRASLAQEIRATLSTRGHWAPERPSDLIGAVATALDKDALAKSDAAACAECILGEESITDEVVEAAQRALEWSRS